MNTITTIRKRRMPINYRTYVKPYKFTDADYDKIYSDLCERLDNELTEIVNLGEREMELEYETPGGHILQYKLICDARAVNMGRCGIKTEAYCFIPVNPVNGDCPRVIVSETDDREMAHDFNGTKLSVMVKNFIENELYYHRYEYCN